MNRDELLEAARVEREYARKCVDHAFWLEKHNYRAYASGERQIAADALARATKHEHAASLVRP